MSHLNVVSMDDRGRAVCKHNRLRHGCPDCKAELTGTKRVQLWRVRSPEKHFALALKQYDVTVEWYETKAAEQKGLCAMCGKPEARRRNGKPTRLAVDHNHKTGAARDLLCSRCNMIVGILESREDVQRGLAYIERHALKDQAA